jgi:hypothetical protein
MDRSNGPVFMPAPKLQLSTKRFTHAGTGIVRIWPPFPLKSAITQRPSRSWKSSNRKVVTSALRRPHSMRSDSRARLRRLRRVSALSAPNNFLPSSAVSQFPTRTPSLRTPFTRRMPAARSGLSSPQSDASYASRRIAANLKLIVDGAYGCCSRAIRYRVTTVLFNAEGCLQVTATPSNFPQGESQRSDIRRVRCWWGGSGQLASCGRVPEFSSKQML